jgi:hypothetical protein
MRYELKEEGGTWEKKKKEVKRPEHATTLLMMTRKAGHKVHESCSPPTEQPSYVCSYIHHMSGGT